jgi:surface antigen
MQGQQRSRKALILGSLFALCCPALAAHADSNPVGGSHGATLRRPTAHLASHSMTPHRWRTHTTYAMAFRSRFAFARSRQVARSSGISCVPYARHVSGIEVAGNAWKWWENAEGHYARGRVPEPGSVLAFRSNDRMRLGHVAVVSRVINAREIEVDHANWGSYRGNIAHRVPVVDVSEANNWTAVRVGLGNGSQFGSVYPTYGFIYDRPDNGVLLAQNAAPAPTPELNPVPSDLRPVAERPWQTYEEVAEAPASGRTGFRVIHAGAAGAGHAPDLSGRVVGQVFAVPALDHK